MTNQIRKKRCDKNSDWHLQVWEALVVEALVDELREKHFHNRVFDSIDALEDQLVIGLRDLENAPDRVKSIAGWEWIINAVSNANWNKTLDLHLQRHLWRCGC